MNNIQVTLRCTNGINAETGTTHRDIVIDCLDEAPFWVPEEGDEVKYGGGYVENSIAYRREWTLVQGVIRYTVREATGTNDFGLDQGHYELIARSLRAKRIYVIDVTHRAVTTDGTHPRVTRLPDDPDEAIAFYGDGGQIEFPHQVTAKLGPVEAFRDRFSFTVTLRDAFPTIGEAI